MVRGIELVCSAARVQRWSCLAVCALLIGVGRLALSSEPEPAKPQVGKAGTRVTTQIQSETVRGATSEDEQRHITVLGAQLLHQINRARTAIDADDSAAANEAIQKARKALTLIQQMLPKKVVSTTVTDSDGTVVFEDAEDVQPSLVTISRSFTELDILRPLVESKKDSTEFQGEEFQGSAIIEADVVVNLAFIERRLREAERALAKDADRADQALALAQSEGTDLVITELESPLIEARQALQFAHSAAEQKQYRSAEANLRIARGYLLLHRETAPEAARDEIDKLSADIDSLAKQISGTTSASHQQNTERAKGILDRVEGWWRKSRESKDKVPATGPRPSTK
jgi:hypothetical protein